MASKAKKRPLQGPKRVLDERDPMWSSLENIRWLLRMIAKKRVPFLQTLFLRLLQHGNLAAMGRWAAGEMAKFCGEVPGRRRLDASVYLALG